MKSYIPLPFINLSKTAITAITNKMWTMFQKFPKKKPKAQRIKRTTAIV